MSTITFPRWIFLSGVVVVIVLISVLIYHDNLDERYQVTQSSDNVYMICDVYDVAYNGTTVEINIVLPNGNLLSRYMHESDDLPEEFEEVIIQTCDLDDYSTYKIVGLR